MFLRLIGLLLAVFLAIPAHAASVVFEEGTVASGIDGLELDGSVYDVRFVNVPVSMAGAYTEFSDLASARSAALAIGRELTNAGATSTYHLGVGGFRSFSPTRHLFTVLYDYTGPTYSYVVTISPFEFTSAYAGRDTSAGFGLIGTEFTRIDTTPIPVPASLPLLILGAGTLGLFSASRTDRDAAQTHGEEFGNDFQLGYCDKSMS